MSDNNSLFIKICCASLLLMASSVVASAQGRISLNGRVTDQTGAGVGAATVTARQLGSSFERSARTGEDGSYRVDDLLLGDYQISARREGFSLAAQTLTIQPKRGRTQTGFHAASGPTRRRCQRRIDADRFHGGRAGAYSRQC